MSFYQTYSKSSKRHGVLTACVKPLTYVKRTTCDKGTPLPVFDSLFSLLDFSKHPTRAAVRAERAALAFLAPMSKKLFCALRLVDDSAFVSTPAGIAGAFLVSAPVLAIAFFATVPHLDDTSVLPGSAAIPSIP